LTAADPAVHHLSVARSYREENRRGLVGKGQSMARSAPTGAMKKPTTLDRLLADSFDTYGDVENAATDACKKADFIFHMTDWSSDLEKLAALYKDPNLLSQKEAQDVIFGFIVHAVPHLNAAHRLLVGEMSDPFAPPNEKKQTCGSRGVSH
jgi:hypothetical protein